MKTITTNHGKEFAIVYAYAPMYDGCCVIELLNDDRPLSEIATDFDGLEWIDKHDPFFVDERYEGYKSLKSIQKIPNGHVNIRLDK